MNRIILVLLVFSFINVQGQSATSYRKLVDEQYVPKEVRTSFKKMYPNSNLSIYYSSHIAYWYQDYAPGWYGDWYPVRQTVVIKLEKPAFYEVDFQFRGNPSRAIFNRYGQWFETRSRIPSLPPEVNDGLRKTEYGDWLHSDHKEILFIPGYDGLVYRLRVTKRDQSYIIRLDEQGNIIQIKYE